MYPKKVRNRCEHCGQEYEYTVGQHYTIMPLDYTHFCPACIAVMAAALQTVPVVYQPVHMETEPFDITDRMKSLRQTTRDRPCKRVYAKLFDSEIKGGEWWIIDGQTFKREVRRENGQVVYFKVCEQNVVTGEINEDKPWITNHSDEYYEYTYGDPRSIKPIKMEPPMGKLFFSESINTGKSDI